MPTLYHTKLLLQEWVSGKVPGVNVNTLCHRLEVDNPGSIFSKPSFTGMMFAKIQVEQVLIMKNEDKTIYVVSGLPRSGTSMMMKMLEAGGLKPMTDNIREADDDNLQGYFEFERVKAMKDGDTAWVGEAQGKVIKVISALLEYLPPGYTYKIIFMEREMMEILASQRKMLERRGKPGNPAEDGKFADLYGKHLDKVKAWLVSQNNVGVMYVRYNEMLSNPAENAEKVAGFLGIPMNLQAMSAVPQEQYYRQRK